MRGGVGGGVGGGSVGGVDQLFRVAVFRCGTTIVSRISLLKLAIAECALFRYRL